LFVVADMLISEMIISLCHLAALETVICVMTAAEQLSVTMRTNGFSW